MCAQYKGDIDTALAAYERADILEEKESIVHQKIADVHAGLGNIEIAKSQYDKADLFGLDPVERLISSKYSPHKFSLAGRLSVGTDSNVQYNAELSEMNDWFGISSYGSSPQSDSFLKEYVRIGHVYNANPYNSLYYKNQLHLYNKNYKNYSEEDFSQVELLSGFGWANKSMDIWLPLSYTYMSTNYQAFAKVIAFKPQFRMKFYSDILLQTILNYENQKYLQWEEGDKNVYGADVSLSKWLGENYFRLGYRYQKYEKENSSSPRAFIDKELHDVEVNYTRKLSSSVEFGLSYLYSKINYSDLARIDVSQNREDDLHRYSGYISYNINEYYGLVLEYDHYNNETNYTPSSYEKEVITAGIYVYY